MQNATMRSTRHVAMPHTPPSMGHEHWHHSQDYQMVNSHRGQMYYDSPPESPDMMSGQLMAPQYMMPSHFSSSVPSMHTYPLAMPYTNYQGPSPGLGHPLPPAGYSNKPEIASHSQPDRFLNPQVPVGFHGFYREEVRQPIANPSPPASRSSSHFSTEDPHAASKSNYKTITRNEPVDTKQKVDFGTHIDELMKVIQVLDESSSAARPTEMPTPASSPKSDSPSSCSSPGVVNDAGSQPTSTATKGKRFQCDGPGCNKTFGQRSHLRTHALVHTGEMPYCCDVCGKGFKQKGNMQNHWNAHYGIKPHACPWPDCDKRFVKRGDIKPHMMRHTGQKPFECTLDNCYKRFPSRGNLKTHQNNHHGDTVKAYRMKCMQFIEAGHIPEEEKAMVKWFQESYKNSNRGIPGRGKDRRIARVARQ